MMNKDNMKTHIRLSHSMINEIAYKTGKSCLKYFVKQIEKEISTIATKNNHAKFNINDLINVHIVTLASICVNDFCRMTESFKDLTKHDLDQSKLVATFVNNIFTMLTEADQEAVRNSLH